MHLIGSVLRMPAVAPEDGSAVGSPGPLLDKPAALSRTGGDTELLAEIAALFLDEYPGLLRAIRDALAQGDCRTAEREAHGLKGSVANFGAEPVVQAALAVEMSARQGDLAQAAARLPALEQMLEKLHPELQALAG